MRHKAYVIAGLSDEDLTWLLSLGQLRTLRAGDRLVQAGRPVIDLFFVVRGTMAVVRGDGTQVATLGEGDVVGEMSFVDPAPPGVSVRAAEPSEVLAVAGHFVSARFDSDPAFAARFYRALAVFLADRLRETTAGLGSVQEPAPAPGDRLRRLAALLGKAR